MRSSQRTQRERAVKKTQKCTFKEFRSYLYWTNFSCWYKSLLSISTLAKLQWNWAACPKASYRVTLSYGNSVHSQFYSIELKINSDRVTWEHRQQQLLTDFEFALHQTVKASTNLIQESKQLLIGKSVREDSDIQLRIIIIKLSWKLSKEKFSISIVRLNKTH